MMRNTSEWPFTTVGELCDQVRGVTYAKSDTQEGPANGFVPILRANNIRDDGVLSFDDLVFVSERCVGKQQFIQVGDIVIAASSGSLSVVGKAAQARSAWFGAFGAFCKVLRPNGNVDGRYLAHFFRTPHYRTYISSVAAGANINNLRNEHLNDLSIPLPPLAEQKRIADILDKADAIRRKRQQAIEQLDTLVQSTFLDMFGDPVTNPMGWEITQLDALVADGDRINYGVVQPGDNQENGVPLIRVGDFVSGHLTTSDVKRISPDVEAKYRRSRLNGSELLVSCVGSIGTVCKATPQTAGFNIARAVARVPLRHDVDRDFMLYCLRSAAVQQHFKKETRTVSQPTLNISLIKNAPIIQPPPQTQHRFSQAVRLIEQHANRSYIHAEELGSLFHSLQQRAFAGEL